MPYMRRWKKRLRALLRRDAVDAELDEEFAFHLEQMTAKLVGEGVEPGEARRRAAVAFGGATRFLEEVREARFFAWVGHAARDMRYVLRGMAHRPGFVAAILVTLSLSIGASVAMFATANALFFRPLPFAHEHEPRLQMLYETNPEFGWTAADAAPANFLDWRENVPAFADAAAYSMYPANATYIQDGEPRILKVSEVTGNFFTALGVRPVLGRAFTWEETWGTAGNVVMLSHATWQSTFGGDPAVIGRTLQLGSQGYQVVGVLPPGFSFPNEGTNLWKPFGWNPADRSAVYFRRAHFVRAFALLKEGVTPEQANAALQVEVERLKLAYPATNRVMGAGLAPLREFLLRDVRKPVLILAGAVLVLLLLACANVANLALLRALGRQQEIALRGALGACRSRLAGMVMVEHAMLAAAGGAIGTALSWAALRALGLTDFGVPAATSLVFDARVALFALVATLACAALFMAAPLAMAVRQGDARLGGTSRGASRGPRMARLTSALVTLEVALAVILVAGAALMAQTAYRLRHVDVGFRTEDMLAVQFTVPGSRYANRDAVLSFYDRLLETLEARPQVERAGTVANLPLAGTSWSSSFRVDGWPAERVGAEIIHRRADRAYFETVGTPLLQGRYLDATDRGDAPLAVVINETFAREHFEGEDPIGKRIVYDRVPTPQSNWYTIVGVVGDQKQVSPARPARAEVFESRDQDWGRNNWVVMRTAVPPLDALATVREVLREMDPLIPIATVRTLDEVKRASMAKENGVLGLLGAFGALALLLAAVGVYAVAAQGARSRTKEIGIRIALGAAAGDILQLVLRRGFAAVGVGLGVGLAVTLLATRALDSLLYGVEATDPGTIAGVAALLFVVGSVACWIPARRATRLDPVSSLRAD